MLALNLVCCCFDLFTIKPVSHPIQVVLSCHSRFSRLEGDRQHLRVAPPHVRDVQLCRWSCHPILRSFGVVKPCIDNALRFARCLDLFPFSTWIMTMPSSANREPFIWSRHRIYGQSAIKTILAGQNHGPFIRYLSTLYCILVPIGSIIKCPHFPLLKLFIL